MAPLSLRLRDEQEEAKRTEPIRAQPNIRVPAVALHVFRIAISELGVVLIAVAVAAVTAIVNRLLPNGMGMGVAILFPILVCLIRAAFVSDPRDLPRGWRHLAYSVSAAASLILLWLFETALGLLWGAAGIPWQVFILGALLAAGYVLLMTTSRKLVLVQLHQQYTE